MKNELKRLKAGVLALIMYFSLSGCAGNKEEKTNNNDAAFVVFIEGKALVYSGEYNKTIIEDYSSIGGNSFKYSEVTRFSAGTDVVEVQSREDAIELATAVVGLDNIIYVDYEGNDMKLTYTKGE